MHIREMLYYNYIKSEMIFYKKEKRYKFSNTPCTLKNLLSFLRRSNNRSSAHFSSNSFLLSDNRVVHPSRVVFITQPDEIQLR